MCSADCRPFCVLRPPLSLPDTCPSSAPPGKAATAASGALHALDGEQAACTATKMNAAEAVTDAGDAAGGARDGCTAQHSGSGHASCGGLQDASSSVVESPW